MSGTSFLLPLVRPTALVTGAPSGIGKETALALVAAGFRGGRHGPGHLTRHPTPGRDVFDLDVVSDKSVTALVQQVIDRYGRIDVLVSKAGIGSIGTAEETPGSCAW
ncbi:NAD(P)-dependent dehydrogenase (short-subunit alcohol dehydrogenase family) [Streptomyces canus]|uniref:SDR family NAD(P)-dependent oxidoreductase n=1 Tax=Streptomyces canus TaxID=58343 RepID=UPI00278634FA|nr:SDR family NAD(P)-dependent oxidoreductase [Streptomyces canus]MDQ0596536.1 NAD(P)-dependent dehydrogenase (short-subunit alcohol dehydrogenase family) [Streptomyces canus]